jgi:hypothetical protein
MVTGSDVGPVGDVVEPHPAVRARTANKTTESRIMSNPRVILLHSYASIGVSSCVVVFVADGQLLVDRHRYQPLQVALAGAC